MKHALQKLSIALLVVFGLVQAQAASWNMELPPVPGYYEFYTSGEMGEGGYSVDISVSDEVGEYGDPLYLVKHTTWSYQELDIMLLQPGLTNLFSFNMGSFFLFMVPMMLEDLDMNPGEVSVFPGFGRAVVQQPETHAGITGHSILIEEEADSGEWQPLMFLVFNEDFGTPLKSIFYEDGEPYSETTLVEFRAH